MLFVDDDIPVRVELVEGDTTILYLDRPFGIKTALHYLEAHPSAIGSTEIRKSKSPIIRIDSESVEEFNPELQISESIQVSLGLQGGTRTVPGNTFAYGNYNFILLDQRRKIEQQKLLEQYGLFLKQKKRITGKEIQGGKIQIRDRNGYYELLKRIVSSRTRREESSFYFLESDEVSFLYVENPSKNLKGLLGLNVDLNNDPNKGKRMELSPLEQRLVW